MFMYESVGMYVLNESRGTRIPETGNISNLNIPVILLGPHKSERAIAER